MSDFNVTVGELKDLMSAQVSERVSKLAEFGGVEGLCHNLKTSKNGLSGDPADLKLRSDYFGSNTIARQKSRGFFMLVIDALQDVTLMILILAASVSLIVSFYPSEEGGNVIESIAIFLTVFVVVFVTAVNDYSKEKQFKHLQSKVDRENTFCVLRDGTNVIISVSEIVVGDVCLVKYGDSVPADGVIIYSNDLKVDESSLTGESELVKKGPAIDPMLYSWTNVMEGNGRMLVTATGINSVVGSLFLLLSRTQPSKKIRILKAVGQRTGLVRKEVNKMDNMTNSRTRSVLQVKLTRIACMLGCFGLIAALLIVVILIFQYCFQVLVVEEKPLSELHAHHIIQYFIIGVTVLVVAVPEGLPLAVTLALAYSVKKMINDNNLVRHLDACETMGNVTSICSDKTGTLTTNRMTVVDAFICDEFISFPPSLSDLPVPLNPLFIEAICINTSYTSQISFADEWQLTPNQVGNTTECALLGLVHQTGIDYKRIREMHPEHQFVHVYTFNSNRKCMATVISLDGLGYRLFVKGAPEILVQISSFEYDQIGQIQLLTSSRKVYLYRNVIRPMAKNGLRTILIAYRDFVFNENSNRHETYIKSEPDWEDEKYIMNNLTILGIVGIEDPVRPEVPKAIRQCQKAGVTVRMVTGDNIATAKTIALKCGIIAPDDNSLVLEGKDFNDLIRDPDGEFQQQLFDKVYPRLRVLARSMPSDKYVLVQGIIESRISRPREVVAVTGDGTNDGPALMKADVGFAMGITGTDVAKQASDIIITDDNFSSIVKAIMWGRNVYDSIAKFLQFQITVNVVAVVIAFVSAATVMSCPLRAVQMLWINLVMDTLASLGLATERPSEELLKRKPYGRTKPLVSATMLKSIIGHTVHQLSILLVIFYYGDIWLNIPSGIGKSLYDPPTQHFTVVFNTFIWMALFNQINSRKIHGEINVFSNIFNNPVFLIIWMFSSSSQVIIIQSSTILNTAFSTCPLDLDLWLWCIFFGINTLLWGIIIKCLPTKKLSEYLEKKQRKALEEIEEEDIFPVLDPDKTVRDCRVMWLRSVSRIRTQIRVVNAMKANIAPADTLLSAN